MGDMASTKAEANDHLQQLREARGIKGHHGDISDSVLVSSLNEALNLLSDQLYTTPTHFLLELIQNADDNTYPKGVVPRLHLSLYGKAGKDIFRSDCNEIGFTFRQLDALTRIGKSTKKATDGRKGYIGEKGIGFKSVFKAADVVRVASGYYEFKFNRRNTIGMMLPIPSKFPSDDRVKDHTQFLLELKRNEDYRQIGGDLKGIGSETLLFLRKLKQLDVSINGERKTYKLRTNNWNSDFGGETATISETTDQQTKRTKYMIERRTVEDLPPDPRREAVATSEVAVAFAVKDQTTPIVKPQQVFAFLPIQDYGFPFLIHADFLLTASRESLEYHCPWNLALRKGIKDAVVTAIQSRFVDLDEDEDGEGLCYSWPMYLRRQPSGSGFWNTLHDDILDALRREKILLSRDRQAPVDFQKPTAVRYVPEAYRFEGETLFDLPSINKTHLSFDYDHVHESLRSIGVSQLPLHDLCEEFCQWVGRVGIAGLKEKPDKWHSRVANIFYKEGEWIRQKLKRLPIIPLRHGSWVQATETHLYLPSPNKNELVPTGVNISIVAEDAVRDASRRKLYEYLDIEEYNPRQVCKLILELHRRLALVWTSRSEKELIDDAVYLFRHRSNLGSCDPLDIIFAVHKDGKAVPKRSTRIYLIDPKSKNGVIAKYKDTPGNPFAVLSSGYEAVFLKHGASRLLPDFREWLLRSSTTFATIVDLVCNSRLTPEWKFLRDRNVLDLLYVVRDQLSTTGFPAPKLVEAVPRLEVRCLDGKSRILGGLAVPTLDLKRHCPHLDFADLPEPTSQNWKFLSNFGVIVEPGTTAILRELQALRQSPVGDVDASAIRHLYEALNSDVLGSKNQIVTAFESKPLVFVPTPKPKWLSHKDCVWTAPELLTRVTKLKAYYRSCEGLFHSLLGVENAGTQHVVDEFCEPTSKEDNSIEQQHFKAMLSLLAKFSRKSSLTDDQVHKIRSAPVLPILAKGFTSAQGLSRIEMRSIRDRDWYIPDIVTFEAAFRGKVDMLALPVHSARALKGLFKDLCCEEEFLSEAVTRSVTPDGITVRNVREEQDLRTRLRYISRVVEGNFSGKIPNVSSIRVWSVPSITVTMSLDDVEITIDDELVTIEEGTDAIDIYLREGIHQSRQMEVAYELAKHFKETIGFDEKFTALINLLMGAPIHSLPGILDKHDVPLPGGSHDDGVDAGSSEETHDLEDNETLVEEGSIHSDGPDGSHDSGGEDVPSKEDSPSAGTPFAPMESGAGTDAERPSRSYRTHGAARRNHPTPLRELIPSHQSRSESIIQRARNFRLSNAEAAASIQHHSSRATPLRFSLPTRTRTTGINADESEYSSPPGMPATGISHHRSLGVGRGAGGGYSSFISRGESSGATHGGRADDTSDIRARGIGFLGELFVFEMFTQQIDDWTFECWTSRMRSEAGHPRFQGRERDFSDFTYVDASGRMRAMLRDAGIEPNAAWSDATKFHLEVKSTLVPCAEPMFVSQNQVDKMREFDGTADNAYILLRVFDLDDGRNAGVKFFRDPWSLYMGGVLNFRSDEGYKVYH
ncbi:hypothetical protein B0H63DRAFT_560413 [Podospora didyma]|uniref:Protein NO VEIN C-terminal domain-containing protein n=1 Tax=Podospora didyma TaxID=330526 RepID=A0AAE0NQQ9_9PEZI|nr:hypothetical protein B0H63DRAFT_560413 [Podospora didyma]